MDNNKRLNDSFEGTDFDEKNRSRNSRSRNSSSRSRSSNDSRQNSRQNSQRRQSRQRITPNDGKIANEIMGVLIKKAPDQDDFDDEPLSQEESYIPVPLSLITELRGNDLLGDPPTMSQIAKRLGVTDYVSTKNKHRVKPKSSEKSDSDSDSHSRSRSRHSHSRPRSDSHSHSHSRSNSKNDRNRYGSDSHSHSHSQSRSRSRLRSDSKSDHHSEKGNQSEFQRRWSQFDKERNISIPITDDDQRVYSRPTSQNRSHERSRERSHQRTNEHNGDAQERAYHSPITAVQGLRRNTPETHSFMANLLARMHALEKEKGIQWSQKYDIDSDPVMAYHEYQVVIEQIELVNKARTMRHKVQRSLQIVEEFTSNTKYFSIKGTTAQIEEEGGFKQFDDDFKLIALQSTSGPRNPWLSIFLGIGLVVLIKWLANVFPNFQGGSGIIGMIKQVLELCKKTPKEAIADPLFSGPNSSQNQNQNQDLPDKNGDVIQDGDSSSNNVNHGEKHDYLADLEGQQGQKQKTRIRTRRH